MRANCPTRRSRVRLFDWSRLLRNSGFKKFSDLRERSVALNSIYDINVSVRIRCESHFLSRILFELIATGILRFLCDAHHFSAGCALNAAVMSVATPPTPMQAAR